MRKKPKVPLSPLQKRRLVVVGTILILVSFLWIIFAPHMGIYSVMRQRSKLSRLQAENAEVEKKNQSLQKEIEQIQKDPHSLEQVAREKYGLLKENEMVFDFSPGKKEKKK